MRFYASMGAYWPKGFVFASEIYEATLLFATAALSLPLFAALLVPCSTHSRSPHVSQYLVLVTNSAGHEAPVNHPKEVLTKLHPQLRVEVVCHPWVVGDVGKSRLFDGDASLFRLFLHRTPIC
jgi:hypothetical protein